MALPRDLPFSGFDRPAPVSAILGPTNTGKTHRAVEKMLRHPSGMIGLPLRLLAREVYDRVSVRVGEQSVALVTGEEKRIPPSPRYWVCTVESMPVDRPVSFLAVDEVQLAANPERGHVFTERILHARGVRETLLLGAATIGPLLERMVPGLRIEQHPRLSKLSFEGSFKLTALPARTALVAFSAAQVYELAERVREVHGGAALVLGALSPRTRNAQVAMYQAGEVHYMVATDAIGMGLNMDVDRVVFTALRKFDGHGVRPLEAAEMGQIAGRAGRFRHDGAFGSLRGADTIPPALASAVENHAFPVLHSIWYRNTDLDFSSIASLLTSLSAPPPFRFMQRVEDADDTDSLLRLSAVPDVLDAARDAFGVRTLWSVCRIPDFHNTRSDLRIRLQTRIFLKLRKPPFHLDDSWMQSEVHRLDRADGDIDALTARIADIRVWTYAAHHSGWLASPGRWQQETREIEDRLSDALHENLLARFVDRRAVALLRSSRSGGSLRLETSADGSVWGEGQRLGRIAAFTFVPEDAEQNAAPGRSPVTPVAGALRAITDALAPEVDRRVAALENSLFEEISWDGQGGVCWDGARVARWEAGETLLAPRLRLPTTDLCRPGGRERVRRRLSAWTRDVVENLLAPLSPPPDVATSPALRGLLFRLRERLGTVPRSVVDSAIQELGRSDRRLLAHMEIRLGTESVFSQALLQPEAMALRGVLWAVKAHRDPVPEPPDGRLCPVEEEHGFYESIGFVVCGKVAVRADLLEEVAAEVRLAYRNARNETGIAAPERVVARLGGEEAASALLVRLGYRWRDGQGWTRPPTSASRGREGRAGGPRGQRPRPR